MVTQVADKPDRNDDPILDPSQQEETDVLFQLEMQARNLLLGYWKHGVAIVCSVLGVIFLYGMVDWFISSQLQATSYQVAMIDKKLAEDDPGSIDQSAPGTDRERAIVAKAAQFYAEAGEDGMGAASAEAWIKAAIAHARLEDLDAASQAYQEALDAKGSGVIGYAARNGLAGIHVAQGDTEAAIALYREIADSEKSYLAERALLDMAEIYRTAGDSARLSEIVEEFGERFPASPRKARLPATAETTAANGG